MLKIWGHTYKTKNTTLQLLNSQCKEASCLHFTTSISMTAFNAAQSTMSPSVEESQTLQTRYWHTCVCYMCGVYFTLTNKPLQHLTEDFEKLSEEQSAHLNQQADTLNTSSLGESGRDPARRTGKSRVAASLGSPCSSLSYSSHTTRTWGKMWVEIIHLSHLTPLSSSHQALLVGGCFPLPMTGSSQPLRPRIQTSLFWHSLCEGQLEVVKTNKRKWSSLSNDSMI